MNSPALLEDRVFQFAPIKTPSIIATTRRRRFSLAHRRFSSYNPRTQNQPETKTLTISRHPRIEPGYSLIIESQ